MDDGRWMMADGGWKLDDGGWMMEDGSSAARVRSRSYFPECNRLGPLHLKCSSHREMWSGVA